MKAFKLPSIDTLFFFAKNAIKFFETPIDQLFFLILPQSNCMDFYGK